MRGVSEAGKSSGEQGAERREDRGEREDRREAEVRKGMEECFGVEEEEVMREEGGWGIGGSLMGDDFFDVVSVVSDADVGACSL